MKNSVNTTKTLCFSHNRQHQSQSSENRSPFAAKMLSSLTRELRRSLRRRDSLAGRSATVARSYSAVTGGNRLEDKVALITGAASGLGRATAQEFINQGAQVIIADTDAHLGPQVAALLGPSAHFVQCDVTVESDVAAAVDAAVARHGRLDVMYNNAGITGPLHPPGIVDLDLDVFDRVMRVNVRGVMAGMKHAARVMVPRGSGSILCTSSISGLMGGLGPYPYSVSKAAIPSMVRAAAGELCRSGVRVNCISPAPVPTPMSVGSIGQFFPGLRPEQVADVVYGMGELAGARCEEGDVARAALYLASDEAKYVSGHNLVVDGAFTCFKTLNFPSPDQLM